MTEEHGETEEEIGQTAEEGVESAEVGQTPDFVSSRDTARL